MEVSVEVSELTQLSIANEGKLVGLRGSDVKNRYSHRKLEMALERGHISVRSKIFCFLPALRIVSFLVHSTCEYGGELQSHADICRQLEPICRLYLDSQNKH